VKRIYLDHNATSPMPGSVLEVLVSALSRLRGNPSSPHAEGQAARDALERARQEVASDVGALPAEVIFTSGGSESNNAALRGVLGGAGREGRGRRPRLITSPVEHPSVLETCRDLEREEEVQVEYLGVDARGVVDPGEIEGLLKKAPADLISVMHANNETGVMQPVERIGELARARGVPFHTDMAQTAGKVPIRSAAARADLVSLAGHKLGGPVGVGVLVVRQGTPFRRFVAGGAQESRRRGGTEPAALALAFAEVLRIRAADPEPETIRMGGLRAALEKGLSEIEARLRLHGEGADRLPNTSNVFFPGAPGRVLAIQLDQLGFAVSTGAACSTGSSRPSHVLRAMGCGPEEAVDSLRISLGPETTRDEIEEFLSALGVCLDRLRAASGAGARESCPTSVS
jgi:cysteine desulfurase